MGAYLDTVLPVYGDHFADWWRDRLVPEMQRNFAYLEGRLDEADPAKLLDVHGADEARSDHRGAELGYPPHAVSHRSLPGNRLDNIDRLTATQFLAPRQTSRRPASP